MRPRGPKYGTGKLRPSGSLEERLWRRVDRSGGPDACWPWTGWRDADGYGRISLGGRNAGHIGTHRAALQTAIGPLADNMFACHRCDNPPCCNPAHLFAGTHADNVRDSASKGRAHGALGADHHRSKLHAHIAAIVTRLDAGEPKAAIARSYGVAKCAIQAIASGRSYRREVERLRELPAQADRTGTLSLFKETA